MSQVTQVTFAQLRREQGYILFEGPRYSEQVRLDLRGGVPQHVACKSYTGPVPPEAGSLPASTATAHPGASHNTTFSEATTQWSGVELDPGDPSSSSTAATEVFSEGLGGGASPSWPF